MASGQSDTESETSEDYNLGDEFRGPHDSGASAVDAIGAIAAASSEARALEEAASDTESETSEDYYPIREGFQGVDAPPDPFSREPEVGGYGETKELDWDHKASACTVHKTPEECIRHSTGSKEPCAWARWYKICAPESVVKDMGFMFNGPKAREFVEKHCPRSTVRAAGLYAASVAAGLVKLLPDTSATRTLFSIPNVLSIRETMGTIFQATRAMQGMTRGALVTLLGDVGGSAVSLAIQPMVSLVQQGTVFTSLELADAAADKVISVIQKQLGKRTAKRHDKKVHFVRVLKSVVLTGVGAIVLTGMTAAPNMITVLFFIVLRTTKHMGGWADIFGPMALLNFVQETVVTLVTSLNRLSLSNKEVAVSVATSRLRESAEEELQWIDDFILPTLKNGAIMSEKDVREIQTSLANIRTLLRPAMESAVGSSSRGRKKSEEALREAMELRHSVVEKIRVSTTTFAERSASSIRAMAKEIDAIQASDAGAREAMHGKLHEANATFESLTAQFSNALNIQESIAPPALLTTAPWGSDMSRLLHRTANLKAVLVAESSRQSQIQSHIDAASAKLTDMNEAARRTLTSFERVVKAAGATMPEGWTAAVSSPGGSVTKEAMNSAISALDTAASIQRSTIEGLLKKEEEGFGGDAPVTLSESMQDMLTSIRNTREELKIAQENRERTAEEIVRFAQEVGVPGTRAGTSATTVVDSILNSPEGKEMFVQTTREHIRVETQRVSDAKSTLSTIRNIIMGDPKAVVGGRTRENLIEKLTSSKAFASKDAAEALVDSMVWAERHRQIETALGRSITPPELIKFVQDMKNEYVVSTHEASSLARVIMGATRREGTPQPLTGSWGRAGGADEALQILENAESLAKSLNGASSGEQMALLHRLFQQSKSSHKPLSSVLEDMRQTGLMPMQARVARITKSIVARVGGSGESVREDIKSLADTISSVLKANELTPQAIQQTKKKADEVRAQAAAVFKMIERNTKERNEIETQHLMLKRAQKDEESVIRAAQRRIDALAATLTEGTETTGGVSFADWVSRLSRADSQIKSALSTSKTRARESKLFVDNLLSSMGRGGSRYEAIAKAEAMGIRVPDIIKDLEETKDVMSRMLRHDASSADSVLFGLEFVKEKTGSVKRAWNQLWARFSPRDVEDKADQVGNTTRDTALNILGSIKSSKEDLAAPAIKDNPTGLLGKFLYSKFGLSAFAPEDAITQMRNASIKIQSNIFVSNKQAKQKWGSAGGGGAPGK
jgi:hypothetical protein